MEKNKVDLYLMSNAKYFESSAIPMLRQKLENASDDMMVSLQACELKDPTTTLLISIFLGSLGIDSFSSGERLLFLVPFGLPIKFLLYQIILKEKVDRTFLRVYFYLTGSL